MIGATCRTLYLKSQPISQSSGLDDMVDNSEVSSAREIPAISTHHIDVRSMPKELQLTDLNDRLHEVARKVTFWKKKANSLAFDSYRTIEATPKLTTASIL